MEPRIMDTPISEGGAVFSNDRSRRYALWRVWDRSKGYVLFIGLNPSIANETISDPTVTRCRKFAERWGYGGVLMGNLYSKVSTDPSGVDFNERDDLNTQYLSSMHNLSGLTVVCWGSNADLNVATETVYYLKKCHMTFKSFYCFAINKNGSPKHPLYLRSDAVVIPYGEETLQWPET